MTRARRRDPHRPSGPGRGHRVQPGRHPARLGQRRPHSPGLGHPDPPAGTRIRRGHRPGVHRRIQSRRQGPGGWRSGRVPVPVDTATWQPQSAPRCSPTRRRPRPGSSRSPSIRGPVARGSARQTVRSVSSATTSGGVTVLPIRRTVLNTIAVSPDGSRIAIGTPDGSVRLGDVALGTNRDCRTSRPERSTRSRSARRPLAGHRQRRPDDRSVGRVGGAAVGDLERAVIRRPGRRVGPRLRARSTPARATTASHRGPSARRRPRPRWQMT